LSRFLKLLFQNKIRLMPRPRFAASSVIRRLFDNPVNIGRIERNSTAPLTVFFESVDGFHPLGQRFSCA
jgi:hypothetical protein